ncbi:translation initiation factor IF-2 [Nitriliruptor alkaliphilus]|uniref:translation initiation factor IF-2 n=1 Tax=Nitriliruptor alkaliphilus TaxID=427918 RepID=UPI0009FB0290|nr:translation initiation factor IF-2 [Nitriliruptor alkaliphilus]
MSNKVRVYELAKETGLHNKEVLRRLTDLGVEASSHSSSINGADAARFRESLGKSEAERKAEEEARKSKERAELERYRSMQAAAPPEGKKAAKVLPPHLRQQQEQASGSAPSTPPAATPPPATPPAATPPVADAPAAEAAGSDAPPTPPATPPAAGEDGSGAPGTPPATPPATRMPGAPPPRLKPGEVPLRPPSTRQAAPPTATGESPEARRRAELNLPQTGSGRRSIPPPLRSAPARPQPTPGQPPAGRGGPPQRGGPPGRGAPGGGPRPSPGGARPGPGSSPYRQAPGGPPRTGGPGGPAGPGGPGGGAPGGGAPGPAGKRRKKKREKSSPAEQELSRGPMRRDVPLEEQITVERVEVLSGITVGELADKLNVAGAALVKKLFEMGEMATVQQTLPDDTVEILGADLGFEVYFMSEEELEFGIEAPEDEENLVDRPPVITVMGHVDHGKTLLLDAIRETDVVAGEAGGITQHIGAYQIRHSDRTITFIDTPGHEAFTAMRARGAQVTDVAILVVAANDGVMPQTQEAITHAKAAGVPIVVAINKIDLEGADPNRVKTQLTEHDLIAEDFGGDTPMVEISALKRQGLDDLIEVVLLQADLLELKANPDKDARGRVVEAHLDRGRGPVATVLVQAGTLRRGDILVAGTADGKIRAMFDENGETVDEATPARPVQVIGLNDVPEAGDEFRVVDAERFARDVAERRSARERRKELAERRPSTLEEFTSAVQAGDKATLNVIIKADVSGSAEALEDSLLKLELDEVQVRVISKGVGAITQADVRLADASDAIIVAFNVRPGPNARDEIARSGVDVRTYRIIYDAIEDIERAVKGMLAPEFREQIIGEAEVREIFKVPRLGFVYGCMVTSGIVRRESGVRVIRDGVVIADDNKMSSLRRFKDDVNEVREGFECGIGLDKFQDVKEGDVIEAFETVEVERE